MCTEVAPRAAFVRVASSPKKKHPNYPASIGALASALPTARQCKIAMGDQPSTVVDAEAIRKLLTTKGRSRSQLKSPRYRTILYYSVCSAAAFGSRSFRARPGKAVASERLPYLRRKTGTVTNRRQEF